MKDSKTKDEKFAHLSREEKKSIHQISKQLSKPIKQKKGHPDGCPFYKVENSRVISLPRQRRLSSIRKCLRTNA